MPDFSGRLYYLQAIKPTKEKEMGSEKKENGDTAK